MKRVFVYSGLLVAGMFTSQGIDLHPWQALLHTVTNICLSYIMIEVGLEFSADMKHPRTYARDGVVATAASTLPWIFCAVYFATVFDSPWSAALLVACFSAPTSAGVLFTMLAAAGLRESWVFKKARVLAIFDDLTTILLLLPIQMLLVGWNPGLFVVIAMNLLLLWVGYRWINRSRWPITKPWILFYGIVLLALCRGFEAWTHIRLEILLPAFILGCVLRHHTLDGGDDPHSVLDQGVKGLFMLLVGCSLPKVAWSEINLVTISIHVIVLTVLSNLGKCVPLLFYRSEASVRHRLALSVSMFPRGEVGAGVLLLALGYGIQGLPILVGSLCLALNLVLTGIFISVVAYLNETRITPPRTGIIKA